MMSMKLEKEILIKEVWKNELRAESVKEGEGRTDERKYRGMGRFYTLLFQVLYGGKSNANREGDQLNDAM